MRWDEGNDRMACFYTINDQTFPFNLFPLENIFFGAATFDRFETIRGSFE
jgi:hypothetical protein